MRSLLPWTLAFALLALPGCMSDGGEEDGGDVPTDPSDPNPPAGASPVVHDGSGSVTAGVGNDQAGSFYFGAGGAAFNVPVNATLMFIELAWDSPALSFDLCVHAPADGDIQGTPICGASVDGGGPGTPTGLVTYTLQAPAPGDGWTATASPDGPSANQAYQLKVTLFFGETSVPAGYSALA